jgi:hypothetical protein
MKLGAVATLGLLTLVFPAGAAGQTPEDMQASSSVIRIDGPPAPVAPAVISRDDDGNATVRAIRLSEPIRLDGQLDEAVYRDTPPIDSFLQSLPGDGDPATEKTEAWITFDADAVYVSARVWDSAPPDQWVANEMRRDTQQLRNNDTFSVALDTYYDRRNSFFFYTNPLGARADNQVTNDGSTNIDWNPIWDVRTGRFEGGWTVEMEIPFKSLRYRPGSEQIWGIQLRRAIRRKNEWAHLNRVPRSVVANGSGSSAILRPSLYGTLVGLETPDAGRNLEVKPYAISGLETDRAATPPISNDRRSDAGVDVKLGLSENLTADFTVNTDFAQVEADEQQVNLTRFELSFPEKREFFLEGRGVYQFASSGPGGGGGGGGNTPEIFFSRRIGLEAGELVPIRFGGRLTGKLGSFDVGAMGIRTAEMDAIGLEATTFTVLRLRRDIFQRSNVGVLFAGRSSSRAHEGSNETYGVDGTFGFGSDLNLNGYYAETRTPGLDGGDQSYRGGFSYNGDRFGASAVFLRVGRNFNPEVGFLRRRAFREATGSLRFNHRPQSLAGVRRLGAQSSIDYVENDTTRLVESRETQAQVQVELESSDVIDVTFLDTYEFLDANFRIADGVILPPGRYSFRDVTVGLNLGLQRWFSGGLSFQRGGFYSGDKTTVGLRTGRINVSDRLSLEPTLSFNWVDLPQGSFRSDLAVTRVNYAFTPRMFFGGLVQYNSGSDSFTTNLRLRWEYRPGSELFIVYTEARDTDVLDRWSELANRGFTIKLNYLLRL